MSAAPFVLMPCSGMKLDRAAPAAELYRGVMWQSLRANSQPGRAPRLVVLSAKHGFVGADAIVEPYEQRLTPERAEELSRSLDGFAKTVRWPRASRRILLAGGGLYRGVMREMVGALQHKGVLARDLQISEVAGGIGEQRSQLGQFLREPGSIDAPFVGYMPNGTPLHRELDGFTVGMRVRMFKSRPPVTGVVKALFVMPWGKVADVELEDERPADLRERRPRAFPLGRWVGLPDMERVCTESEGMSYRVSDLGCNLESHTRQKELSL